MDHSDNGQAWPSVPEELKNVALRLPASFRSIIQNPELTNEEIGRIIRCVALNTDFFVNDRVEAEVVALRRELSLKDMQRKRTERYRNKKNMMAKSQNGGTVTVTVDTVTVTHGAVDGSDSTSCTEKSSPTIPENTPPIVPLQKRGSSPLEKKSPRQRKKGSKGNVGDLIQRDLFAMVTESGSLESLERRGNGPTGDLNVSSSMGTRQDIEPSSGGVIGSSGSDSSNWDLRDDSAWISVNFSKFWMLYPRKVAKGAAKKAFYKIIKSQGDVENFMATLTASLEWWKTQPSWTSNDGKYIPYPATWLNRGQWEDINSNSGDDSSKAEFLKGDTETDADLIRRMQGG